MEIKVLIADNVDVDIKEGIVNINGKLGNLSRNFNLENIYLKKEYNEILLSSLSDRKRYRTMLGTIKAHINNMMSSVTDGVEYKLKIVYSHFPMSVKVSGNELKISNFLGEKHDRGAKILENVNVKISGSDVIVTGYDLEKVGQTAANIEQATKIRRRDPRVFQDGIYIVEKNGKKM